MTNKPEGLFQRY